MQVQTQDAEIAALLDTAALRESAAAARSPDEIRRMIEDKIADRVVVRVEGEVATVQRVLHG